MPKAKGSGIGSTHTVSVRLDPETHAYIKRAANDHGRSMAEYIRLSLVRGMTMKTLDDMELRMQSLLASVESSVKSAVSNREVLMATFTTNEILKEMVAQRDESLLVQASELAQDSVQRVLAQSGAGVKEVKP
jgi:predicted DNA-binding protein